MYRNNKNNTDESITLSQSSQTSYDQLLDQDNVSPNVSPTNNNKKINKNSNIDLHSTLIQNNNNSSYNTSPSINIETTKLHNSTSIKNNDRSQRDIGEVKQFNIDEEMAEYINYSFLIGLQDILSDIDAYIIYFLLIDTIGCDFKSFYGIISLAYSIVQLTWWPIIGVFVDYCDKNLLIRVTRLSCVLFTLIFCCFLFTTSWFFVAVYVIRWMIGNLIWSTSWKLLKIKIDLKQIPIEEQEKLVNVVCSRGDVYSQVFAVLVLTGCLSLVMFDKYTEAKYFLYFTTIFIGFIMVICSYFLKNDVITSQNIFNACVYPKIVAKVGYIEGSSLSERFYKFVVDTFLEYYDVYKIHPIKNSFFHAIVVYLIWNCISSPIAFDLLDSPYNYGPCEGYLFNLVVQGFGIQIGYLIVGPLYFLFIAKMDTSKFYGYIFPISGVLISIFLAMVYTGAGLNNNWLTWGLLGFFNAWTYYLNSYDFYVMSSWTPAKNSGTVQSLYWWINQLVSLGPGAFLASNTSIEVIVIVCVILTAIAVIHSFYMLSIFDYFTAEEKVDDVIA